MLNSFCRASLVALLAAAALVTGCASQQKKPESNNNAKSAPTAAPVAAPVAGMNSRILYLPTGEAATSAVKLEKTGPAEVTLNQPFTYTITATNLTNEALEGVVISDMVPAGLEIRSSEPPVAGGAGRPTWNIGTIGPKGSSTVKVTAVAKAKGNFTYCADITWSQHACITVAVVEPALKLTKQMPAAIMTCDPVNITLTVTNNGSGTARNVVVRDMMPNGMVADDGKSGAAFTVGDLAAGESKTMVIKAKVSKSGEYVNEAVATADGGLESKASASLKASKPSLTLSKKGTEKVYAGRQISYTLEVKNTGDGDAKDTVVIDTLPAGVGFVSADNGGANAGGQVKWALGTLKPGEARTLGLIVTAPAISVVHNTASASAYCADAVSAVWDTNVVGIPGVLLEVVDIEDPVQVGDNVVYVITITNQGSAPQTNINVSATLPASEQFVSGGGASAATAAGQKITFGTIANLPAKQKIEWRLTVKAIAEDDARLMVQSKSDQQTKPVEETESTNLYK